MFIWADDDKEERKHRGEIARGLKEEKNRHKEEWRLKRKRNGLREKRGSEGIEKRENS